MVNRQLLRQLHQRLLSKQLMQQLYLQLSNGQFLRQLHQQLSNKIFLDSTTTKYYTEHSYGGSDVADSERVRKHLNGVNIDSFSNGKNRSELII